MSVLGHNVKQFFTMGSNKIWDNAEQSLVSHGGSLSLIMNKMRSHWRVLSEEFIMYPVSPFKRKALRTLENTPQETRMELRDKPVARVEMVFVWSSLNEDIL